MAEDVDPKLAAAPEAATGREQIVRRTREFGKALLKKLAPIGVSQSNNADALDVYQDMQGIVDLDADTFLQPLEPLSEERHGER